MALRAIPIRKAGNRDNLFMGGDREIVMFSGLMAAALIFTAQELRAAIVGVSLWLCVLYAARLAAKSDPKMRFVYLRQRRYRGARVGKLRGYYPARSTPFRENPNSQGKQYR